MRHQGIGGRNWDGTYLGMRRVLIHICCKIFSQEKYEISYLVVSGVIIPHGCKYLATVMVVFIDGMFIYVYTYHFHKPGV